MSKLLKISAVAGVVASALVFSLDTADARHRHRHYGYWGWGPPGFGYGLGVRYGYPGPYYPYYAPAYRPYYGPACQRYFVRSWRHGRWVTRRVVRCW
jgi:hypothetical protein